MVHTIIAHLSQLSNKSSVDEALIEMFPSIAEDICREVSGIWAAMTKDETNRQHFFQQLKSHGFEGDRLVVSHMSRMYRKTWKYYFCNPNADVASCISFGMCSPSY